jgi:predicted membrane protein
MRRLDDENAGKPENNSHRHDKRLGLGIVFIFIGIVFVLSNLGLIPFPIRHYVFSWQMILIVIGLFSIAGNRNKTHGLILISIGVVFMMPGILGFPGLGFSSLWPLALIGLGAYILFKQKTENPVSVSNDVEFISDGIDTIDDLNVFSGSNRKITSQNFKGGRITCVFGGADYNLTNAGMNNSLAVLDVLTIFGGTKIVVPSDWGVTIDVVSIFGGFADKRHSAHHINVIPQNRLVIKGFTIFGGGEVKDI